MPEQVSLVCLDSDPSFDWCTPSIAHIRWEIAPVVRRLAQWAKSVSQGRNYVKLIPGGTIGPFHGTPPAMARSGSFRPLQRAETVRLRRPLFVE